VILVWGLGNFLIAGMNAPDRYGRVLLVLAHPLSYRPHGWGGAGLSLIQGPGTDLVPGPSSIAGTEGTEKRPGYS